VALSQRTHSPSESRRKTSVLTGKPVLNTMYGYNGLNCSLYICTYFITLLYFTLILFTYLFFWSDTSVFNFGFCFRKVSYLIAMNFILFLSFDVAHFIHSLASMNEKKRYTESATINWTRKTAHIYFISMMLEFGTKTNHICRGGGGGGGF
jgi:hypothetical protein